MPYSLIIPNRQYGYFMRDERTGGGVFIGNNSENHTLESVPYIQEAWSSFPPVPIHEIGGVVQRAAGGYSGIQVRSENYAEFIPTTSIGRAITALEKKSKLTGNSFYYRPISIVNNDGHEVYAIEITNEQPEKGVAHGKTAILRFISASGTRGVLQEQDKTATEMRAIAEKERKNKENYQSIAHEAGFDQEEITEGFVSQELSDDDFALLARALQIQFDHHIVGGKEELAELSTLDEKVEKIEHAYAALKKLIEPTASRAAKDPREFLRFFALDIDQVQFEPGLESPLIHNYTLLKQKWEKFLSEYFQQLLQEIANQEKDKIKTSTQNSRKQLFSKFSQTAELIIHPVNGIGKLLQRIPGRSREGITSLHTQEINDGVWKWLTQDTQDIAQVLGSDSIEFSNRLNDFITYLKGLRVPLKEAQVGAVTPSIEVVYQIIVQMKDAGQATGEFDFISKVENSLEILDLQSDNLKKLRKRIHLMAMNRKIDNGTYQELEKAFNRIAPILRINGVTKILPTDSIRTAATAAVNQETIDGKTKKEKTDQLQEKREQITLERGTEIESFFISIVEQVQDPNIPITKLLPRVIQTENLLIDTLLQEIELYKQQVAKLLDIDKRVQESEKRSGISRKEKSSAYKTKYDEMLALLKIRPKPQQTEAPPVGRFFRPFTTRTVPVYKEEEDEGDVITIPPHVMNDWLDQINASKRG